MRDVLIVRTGTANLASMQVALRRVGGAPRLTTSAAEVRSAERVVLPGVGAFDAARRELDRSGLADALRERALAGAPTLAVCLGLQLLGVGSEEAPGTAGLGVLPCVARRFPAHASTPQIGWNRVVPRDGSRWMELGYAYFAHSYRFAESPPGWTVATTEHGGPFVAALERGDVLGCQFHPELSGRFGRELLARWMEGGAPC